MSGLLGWGFLDYVHPDEREAATRKWAESVRTGKPYAVRCRVMTVQGLTEVYAVAAKVRDRWLGTLKFGEAVNE